MQIRLHVTCYMIESVLCGDKEVRFVDIVQIMEILSNGENLRMLCPYCNPCNPFQMVDVTLEIFDGTTWFSQTKMLVQNSIPHSIKAVLYWANMEWNGNAKEQTRKDLLKTLGKIYDNAPGEYIPHSIDIHAMGLLFPANSTLLYSGDFETDPYERKMMSIKVGSKPVNYPGILRPVLEEVWRNTWHATKN